jgi:GH35 family endo-1,4-beta-xylanase
VLRLLIDNNIRKIAFWGIADRESWYEVGESEPEFVSANADALLFDDRLQPKFNFFLLLRLAYLKN